MSTATQRIVIFSEGASEQMSKVIDFNDNFHSFIYENVARLPFQSIAAAHNVFERENGGFWREGRMIHRNTMPAPGFLLAVSALKSEMAVKGNQRPQ